MASNIGYNVFALDLLNIRLDTDQHTLQKNYKAVSKHIKFIKLVASTYHQNVCKTLIKNNVKHIFFQK